MFSSGLAAGAVRDFKIVAYPSNPIEGQIVHFHAVPKAWEGKNPYLELDYAWDFDDSGSTYSLGGGAQSTDANTAAGFYVAHVYETAGTYNPTVTVRDIDGNVHTKSVEVVVATSDSITWDYDVYVSFANDFTWAPSATGNVTHIADYASFHGQSFVGSDINVRMTFADDETFIMGTTSCDLTNEGIYCHIRRSGHGTNRPLIRANGTLNNHPGKDYVFAFNGLDNYTVIINQLDFEGGYDPDTGIGTYGRFEPFYFSKLGDASGVATISYFRCAINGTNSGVLMQGSGRLGKRYLGISDVLITNWADYGVEQFGTGGEIAIVGSKIAQSAHAIHIPHQGYSGPSAKDPLPESPDHGPARLSSNENGCIENSKLYSNSGWSPLGDFNAIQTSIRLNGGEDTYPNMLFNIARNITVGRRFLIGPRTSGEFAIAKQPMAVVVHRNTHHCGRQPAEFVQPNLPNYYVYNNVQLVCDIQSVGTIREVASIVDGIEIGGSIDYNTFAMRSPPWTKFGEWYFGYNTIIRQETDAGAGGDQSGANNLGDFADFTVTSVGKYSFIINENNIVECPNFDNYGDLADWPDYKPLSPGNNWKPVTTSPAINAVTTGFVPVRDHDGNLRSTTTNIGAHHDTVGSSASVDAPVCNVAPTIQEYSSFPNWYGINSFGDWDNLSEQDEYRWEPNWKLNGILLPEGHIRAPVMLGGTDGTFTGTQSSHPIAASQVQVTLTSTNWTGNTVQLQSKAHGAGSWTNEGTAYSSDQSAVAVTTYTDGTPRLWRLTVTAKGGDDIDFNLTGNGVDTLSCDLVYTNASGSRTSATASNTETV